MRNCFMKSRNTSFDVFKGFACIGIVLMHSKFPEPAGTGFRSLACFGVPLFFSISGYYLSSKELIDPSNIIRKIHHILIMIAGSEIFYSVFSFLLNGLYDPVRRASFIETSFKKGWFEKYIVLNQPPVYDHLWFLYALLTLYLLVLLFARSRKGILRVALPSVPVLLICIVLLQELKGSGIIRNGFHLISSETELYKSSFFLFRAAPFFLLGFLFYEYRERVQKINTSLSALTTGIVACLGIAIVEGYIFPVAQFYVGNITALFLIMVLCIKYPYLKIQPFWYIGTHLSTLVYIYHVAVMHFLDKIYVKSGLESTLWNCIKPILVILITLFVSLLHVNMKKILLSRR